MLLCLTSYVYVYVLSRVYISETEKTRVPAYITLPTGQRYLKYKNNIALGAR